MQRGKGQAKYLVQEPTTGLFAVFNGEAPARLDYQVNATRFPSRDAALVAVGDARLNEQPHEIVRVSA